MSFEQEAMQDISISITDITGKEVYRKNLQNFKGNYSETIQLPEKGTYNLELKSNSGSQVVKVIKL